MRRDMTCRDGAPLLVDYLEGTLPGSVRSALEDHVAGCRRCRGFLRSYVATPGIVRRATARSMPRRVGRELRLRLFRGRGL